MTSAFSTALRGACLGLIVTVLLQSALARPAGEPRQAGPVVAAPVASASAAAAAAAAPAPIPTPTPASAATASPAGTTAAAGSNPPASATGPAAAVGPPAAPAVPAAAIDTPPATAVPPGPYAAARAAQAGPATAVSTSSAAGSAVASAGSMTQVALVLLLIVGLIGGVAWLLRRLGMVRNDSGTAVRIVSGLSLSNRERILVVEVADQWIVVGVAPGGINTLATMPRQESPAPGGAGIVPPAGKTFALWLKQTIEKRNNSSNGGNSGKGGESNGN